MTARYREIAARLREEIEVGRWLPGGMLPSLDDLARRFKTSKVTARRAVELLETAGLVRVVQGRGTEVVDRRPVPLLLSRYSAALRTAGQLGPWALACTLAGVDGRNVAVDVEHEEAAGDVAQALGVDPGALLVRRDRHAQIEGVTVQLQTAWYPLDLFAGSVIAGGADIQTGMYAAMVAAGVQLRDADETVSARAATLEEAAELRMREGAPVLVTERVTRAAGGRVVELLRVVANASRIRQVYDGMPIG